MKAALHQNFVAVFILMRLIPPIMGLAIHFDGKSRRQANEVERIRRLRELPAKFVAAGPLLEFLPKQDFGQAHRFAKAARALYLLY
jgi:hypothetical protein